MDAVALAAGVVRAACRDAVASVAQGTLYPDVVVMADGQALVKLPLHYRHVVARGNHDGKGDDGDNGGGIVVRQMSLTIPPPLQQTIVSFS